MALYHYKARNAAGADVEGDREANDQYDLARILRSEGFQPLFVVATTSVKRKRQLSEYLPAFLHRVSLEEKLNFARNTAVMIGAGVSLAKALDVMSRQSRNQKFKEIMERMAESVKRGRSFSEAIGDNSKIFPKFFQEMVRAGEKSGKLEDSLKLISLQLKKDYAIRRKAKSAMVYPAIIIVAMAGIGILMLVYVVPTLVSTFQELNVELPASTKLVIFISTSLLESGLIFLGLLAGSIYGFFRFKKTDWGKRRFDWLITKTPVIRGINQKFNSARTCRTLSSLISSGVDILEALSVTKGVVQNSLYQEVLETARSRIQKGESISKSFLGAENLYPPLVGEMMAVGEETGELSQMLLRLASFYENEVAIATKDLSTIIEPVLMILIGIVVGFFAIAMISPMYNLVGAL